MNLKDVDSTKNGSEENKEIKQETDEAETGTDPAWTGCGEAAGLQIWRINSFKVEHWPKADYGQFYDGDSYIILNTYTAPGRSDLSYDVHFWIGRNSTQDEYGTAAYKTVELDGFLEDKPIQHREVQGHESDMFKNYFQELMYMKGGCDSGFRKVEPEKFVPRLFHIIKENDSPRTLCNEIDLLRGNINSDDVFLIDTGVLIYQYNGITANKDELYKGACMANSLVEKRLGKIKKEVIDADDFCPGHPAYDCMEDGESNKDLPGAGDTGEAKREMYCLSDNGGKLKMDLMDGFKLTFLNSDDVFLVNSGEHVYCWIGIGASVEERKNGMTYANDYVSATETPWLPISVLAEGKESVEFFECFQG